MPLFRWVWASTNRLFVVAIAAGPENRTEDSYFFGLIVMGVWLMIEINFVTFFYLRERRDLAKDECGL